MENTVKLTKLASCAGCGAKVGAGVLAQLLEGGDPLLKPELLALALPRELMASLYLLVL